MQELESWRHLQSEDGTLDAHLIGFDALEQKRSKVLATTSVPGELVNPRHKLALIADLEERFPRSLALVEQREGVSHPLVDCRAFHRGDLYPPCAKRSRGYRGKSRANCGFSALDRRAHELDV
jgi:hypothetical protein